MNSSFDVGQFGIIANDEYPHPFSPDHPDWNESYFFDWYNDDASFAGHCRIGWHPVQQRVLFWLHLYHDQEWLIIEEYRLPLSALQLSAADKAFSYQGWGLEFSYSPRSPLLSGALNVSGFARVLSGKRQGMVLPVELNLNMEALAAPHSRGAGEVESHSAQGYSTNRYEQPIQAHCEFAVDGHRQTAQVRGERDHSWGPRPWDMEWSFLVVNNQAFSLQATMVQIPEWPAIKMGYFKETNGDMLNLTDVDFKMNFNADTPARAVQGRFSLTCNNTVVSGDLSTLTGTEIDITHTFSEPRRSEYRRSLVSCQFHDQYAGTNSLGWFESNRNVTHTTD